MVAYVYVIAINSRRCWDAIFNQNFEASLRAIAALKRIYLEPSLGGMHTQLILRIWYFILDFPAMLPSFCTTS
jgi:hypothetical protein